MKLKIFGALLMAVSVSAFSVNFTKTTSIDALYTYGEDAGFSQNIISIKVASSVVGCEDGFWVNSTDTLANKNIAAFLLSAFHTGSDVYFAGYTDQKWVGNHCKIHSLGLVKKT